MKIFSSSFKGKSVYGVLVLDKGSYHVELFDNKKAARKYANDWCLPVDRVVLFTREVKEVAE